MNIDDLNKPSVWLVRTRAVTCLNAMLAFSVCAESKLLLLLLLLLLPPEVGRNLCILNGQKALQAAKRLRNSMISTFYSAMGLLAEL